MDSIAELDPMACEREPIHALGVIQPFGAFLAADCHRFIVTHASANLPVILGRRPGAVLGAPLESVIGAAACAALTRRGEDEPDVVQAGSLRLHGFRTGNALGIDLEPTRFTAASTLDAVQALADSFKTAVSAAGLCDMAVRGLRRITGYDRVVAYRFHADGHGEVIAEARTPAAESFLGLHFPASDVPPQAHALYLRKLVGVIADADAVPAAILAHPAGHRGVPLDLTLSDLRGISPRHLQYMRNMGTAAALRIGLPDGERLWGLIVCHHLSPRLPGPDQRAAAALIGQIAALKLRNLAVAESETLRRVRRTLLARVAERLVSAEPVAATLECSHAELLGLVGAAGALVRYDGTAVLLGHTPPLPACLRILETLQALAPNEIRGHDDLGLHHPGLAECAAAASGALLAALPPGDGDAILWFRPERAAEILWGGNPAEHVIFDAATRKPGPRQSFAAWADTVRGRSVPWSDADLALAREFRSAFAAAAAGRMKSQLVRLRDYDPVTGLPKWERLRQWLVEPNRHSDTRIALIAIDLGGLNQFDLLLSGDGVRALLIEIAQRLLSLATHNSLAARDGDTEFLVLMFGFESDEIKAHASVVRQAIEAPYLIAGHTIQIAPTYRCMLADEASGRDLGGAAGLAIASAKAAGAFKRHVDTQRQKMEGLGRMIGGVAHEINNMLQPVTLLGQDLLDKNLLRDEGREMLSIMLDCCRRARQIIGDLMAFSRSKGRATETLEPAELLNDTLRLVRQTIPPSVALAVEIAPNLPRIRANRTTFAQILLNLATNAVAAMQASGRLTVQLCGAAGDAADVVAGADGAVRMAVTDTGCGMTKEVLDRAFEPFFTTKPVGQGTGLGLPVVFGLVEEMAGSITLTSQPGEGTTVTILIPCLPEPDYTADALPASPTPPQTPAQRGAQP